MRIPRPVLIILSSIIVLFMGYILIYTTPPKWFQTICAISLAINSISVVLNSIHVFDDYYLVIGKPEEDKKEEAFNKLKHIDFKYIEQYVRMKKLKSLK